MHFSKLCIVTLRVLVKFPQTAIGSSTSVQLLQCMFIRCIRFIHVHGFFSHHFSCQVRPRLCTGGFYDPRTPSAAGSWFGAGHCGRKVTYINFRLTMFTPEAGI